MIEVPVELGERSYRVWWAPAPAFTWPTWWPRPSPRPDAPPWSPRPASGSHVDPGLPFDEFTVPDGEGAKSLTVVEELCRGFARAGLSRSDVVIAVGGGVVTDLAGFAAASFHRGTAYVNVATTLLAQVDAAVGGKTGVNIPEGKNLVGAFWQPSGVICDTELLATLPPREWASGRGEMAKYAFLGGSPTGAGGPDASLLELPLDEQVARCVGIKADVVAADEREGDRRMVLNYGHTLGHALEAPPSSPAPTSTSATARPWPSGWCTPLCWPAGSAGSTTVVSSCTAGWSGPSTCRPRCPPASSPSVSSRSWPATRRRPTTSPSCWTARGGSRWPAGWTRPMSWLPLRRCTARNQVARR